MQFFRDSYGLDFTNVEPDEKGRRSLGNATMRPFMTPYNNTFVDRWIFGYYISSSQSQAR